MFFLAKSLYMYFLIGVLLITITLKACQKSQQEKYESTYKSLQQHSIPQWFDHSKFGIFIHWGVYSVPAWGDFPHGSEWYLPQMSPKSQFGANSGGPPYTASADNLNEEELKKRVAKTAYNYHRKHYGSDFAYDEFISRFKAENYDPAAWADLFKQAGARYVVLTAKHGDEFALWPTEYTDRNAGDMGPHRDLVGDLSSAVRAEGMKMGLYHNTTYSFWDERYPNKEWVEYMNNTIKELVDLYQPDILWGDVKVGPARDSTGNPLGTGYWNGEELLAYFYNHSKEPGEVVANDRWGECSSGPYLGDYRTPERRKIDTITPDKWETCMTITGSPSWGYDKSKEPEDYWTVNALVDYLIDIVSKNGNLLLNIGPKADGTIPAIMQERLLGIGRWLEINGDAIYGTTYWKTFGEDNIRFTKKGDNTLYAIALAWPGEEVIIESLKELDPDKVETITMLGDGKELDWHMTREGLVVEPPRQKPCDHAYSFKINYKERFLIPHM